MHLIREHLLHSELSSVFILSCQRVRAAKANKKSLHKPNRKKMTKPVNSGKKPDDKKKGEVRKGARKGREKALEEAVQRILNELTNDLRTSRREVQAAEMDAALSGKDSQELMSELLKEGSALCKAIPVNILRMSRQGKQYLDILGALQPTLKEVPVNSDRQNVDVDDKGTDEKNEVPQNQVAQIEQAPDVESVLPSLGLGEDDGQLADLVKEVLASGDMCRLARDGAGSSDIMGMFSAVTDIVNRKASEGSLDLAALDRQAQAMLGRMQQDHPELQDALGSTDVATLLSFAGSMR